MTLFTFNYFGESHQYTEERELTTDELNTFLGFADYDQYEEKGYNIFI